MIAAAIDRYDNHMRSLIWLNAPGLPGSYDRAECFDRDGKRLRWTDYGQTTEYGWIIDYIIPKSEGGSESPLNLQPLHWRTRERGCAVDQ